MSRPTTGRWALCALLIATTGLSAQEPDKTAIASAQALARDAGTISQDPVSDLGAILAEAEANNPTILAAEKKADAARARISQAGALPDPTLAVGVMNFPVADPSLGREMMTMARVQLSESFPWPGKRGLREAVARRRADAAGWEVERVRDEVTADVKATYSRIYFLDRALAVTGRNETLIADFADLTSTRYAVGAGTQPDVLKAQVERTRLADQLVVLRERRVSALARLNALVGRPSDTPLPGTELPEAVRAAALEVGGEELNFAFTPLEDVLADEGPTDRATSERSIPTVAEVRRLALESNPAIQAHQQRVAALERAAALAGKAKLPDFNVSVGYSRRPRFGDFVDFMVAVPLPVFSDRKQDQGVVEHEASLAEHEARHHAMVDELNAEIESLVAGLRRARAQLVLLDDGILPQARTSLASATASYRVGEVDFLTLLDAQVTLYRHELDYHRLLADFAADLARLERAVGTEVLR